MKPVKLLTLTSWAYVIVFAVLTLIFFVVFFFIIQKGISESADEALYKRKFRILREIAKSRNRVTVNNFQFTDFRIERLDSRKPTADLLSDTLIYEASDQENYEFRKLSTVVAVSGKDYILEIVVPQMERDEIISSLIKTLSLVFILMVSIFFFTSLFLSKKLWQSFYITLNKLNTFEIDRSANLDLKTSRIEEFGTLNQSISELIIRVRRTFNNQKQFIENASHELQTPLAINQNKLEQLIDDPNLTESQSEIIQTLINSSQRMSRLNKTLLLLSKIENEQYFETELVSIAPLVQEVLTIFEDQKDTMQISVITELENNAFVTGNKMLTDLLLSNLIKNAFVHNYSGGAISVKFEDHFLTISNTSKNPQIPTEKLFQRFYKNTTRKESWGLGLAIVNKICILNNWQIGYSVDGGLHSFSVRFCQNPVVWR